MDKTKVVPWLLQESGKGAFGAFVVAVVNAVFNGLPDLTLILLGLGSFLGAPHLWKYIQQVSPLGSSKGEASGSWASDLVHRDRGALADRLKICGPRVDWSQLTHSSEVIFIFPLVNASVFKLKAQYPIVGRVVCSAEDGNTIKCDRELETAQNRDVLSHGQERELRFTLQLTGNDMGYVTGGHSPRNFSFAGVYCNWESEAPDGSKGPDFRLRLPDTWQVPAPYPN